MDINVTKPIDRGKWMTMLGIPAGGGADLEEQFARAEALIRTGASPRGIYRVMDVSDIRLEGFSIQKHLEGCMQAAVMAVTLGAGIDGLLRREQVRDMASAVVIDCGASLYIEEACDIFAEVIRTETGLFTTSRFSPGYGDYPLYCQEDVLRYVDGQRKIGINITSNSPNKRVYAFNLSVTMGSFNEGIDYIRA